MTGFGFFIRAYMLVSTVAAVVTLNEAYKRKVNPDEFLISLLKELVEFFGFH